MAEKNATILDAIWLEGTNDYQQRVPQATQDGVAAVQEFLFNPMNKNYFNQFVDSLINRIGKVVIRDNQWKNPLSALKEDGIEYGSTIQEIGFKLLRAKGYDIDDLNLFVNEAPEALVAYHTVDRQNRYDLTIQSDELRKAFVNEGGLSQFISGALALPLTSDQYDEFQIMKQLFAAYGIDKMQNIQIPDLTSATATKEDAENVLVEIRAAIEQFRFLDTKYNKAGYPAFAMPEDVFIYCTPRVKARIDVKALAAAFNLEYAEAQSRIIVLDSFPAGGNEQIIIAHKNWFVCGDYVNEIDSFYNPKTRTQNYYLHRWGIYSASPFLPILRLSKDASTVVPEVTTELDGALTLDPDNITLVAGAGEQLVTPIRTVANTPANEELIKNFGSVTYDFVDTDDDLQGDIRIVRRGDAFGIKLVKGSKATGDAKVEFTTTYVDPATGVKDTLSATLTITVA